MIVTVLCVCVNNIAVLNSTEGAGLTIVWLSAYA